MLSLDGKAVGALASTGAGSTPATEYPHLFVRGSEYAHKGGFWCYREEDDEGDAPSRWIACDMLTADLLYKLASVEMAASDLVLSHDKAHKHNKELLDALAAARAEVETLTRDRDGWERRTKELGSVVIRAWALLRDWWQYAQLEEREEPFVDALTRALAADAEHDAYALAEIRRWRDVAGEAARLAQEGTDAT